MKCELSKNKIETRVSFVGKSGKEYAPYENLVNTSAESMFDKGKLRLPASDYPYTVKTLTKYKFECCNNCICELKY